MVKPGYKQTEAGVIPEDWGAEPLGELTLMMTNGFVGTATRHYTDEGKGVRYIHGYNVIANSFDFHGVKFVDESFHRAHLKSCLRAGDVLTVQTGDVGLTTVVTDELAGSNCHALIISRFDQKKASPRFVSFYLNSGQGRSRLKLIEIGTTMKHLNVGDMLQFSVPLPSSLPEQQAIASALLDADELIGSLEQLLTKKRQIKQGAMQELLTGKKRLPGFSGEWKVKTLKQMAEIAPGINKPVSEMGRGSLYVTVQDVYNGTSIRTERLGRIHVSPEEIQSKALMPGDIVFGKSSVKREGIGYPSQFLGCVEPVVFSGFTYRARARKGITDAAYLFYSLRLNETRRWLIDNSQASALTNINQRIADAIPVKIPPTLPEQTAIAEVLSDMDAEIEALETKLTKARQVKQGMMQELLTGRIRLV